MFKKIYEESFPLITVKIRYRNRFFVDIGPTLASKITTEGISHRNFLKENLQSSFFLEPTNINEIKEVISKLKNGAPGRDEILPKHLKCISESIAHPL